MGLGLGGFVVVGWWVEGGVGRDGKGKGRG